MKTGIKNRLVANKRFQKLYKKITFSSLPEYTTFSIYAIFIGIVVGLAAVFFHHAIEFLNDTLFHNTESTFTFVGTAVVIIFPAVGMLIQSFMIKGFPAIAKQKGVSEVIKAVAMRGGYIPFRTTLFHFLAPVICIGSGGTVGPEGPAAQLGGGVSSRLGQLFGLSDSRRRMFTAAGAGAAISAIFNTPLGGIFFALEIILLNDFQSATFSALILASVTASAISRVFLGDNAAFNFDLPSITSYDQLYLFIILGLLAGILSILFIRYSASLDKFFHTKVLKKAPQWLVMTSVGLLVGISGFFYEEIFGIGYMAINKILAGELPWNVVLIVLALKFILVPMILYSGGFGGLFAPSLFIGACFGFLFALGVENFWVIEVDSTIFVLVGMGAVLGGVNSIPISSILIIFEMTKDYSYILPLMLAVVISTTIVQLVLKGSVHVKHLEEEGFSISGGRERSILKSIKAKEIVREDIVLIKESTSLHELIGRLLETNHNTYYVIDDKEKIIGSISESELRPIITEYEQIREVIVASDIANNDVITINENDDLDYVLKLFGKASIDEFPVIADDGNLLGTILRADVIAAYNKESLKFNLADGLAYELSTIQKTETSKVAEGHSITESIVPNSFIGKSLVQLRIRNQFGLEVLMIKQKKSPFDSSEKEPMMVADPNYIIQSGDTLVLFGADEDLEKIKNWK